MKGFSTEKLRAFVHSKPGGSIQVPPYMLMECADEIDLLRRRPDIEWQPIETAPKEGLFLACMENAGKHYELVDGMTYWAAIALDAKPWMPTEDAKKMTHWMRLPPLPPNTRLSDPCKNA